MLNVHTSLLVSLPSSIIYCPTLVVCCSLVTAFRNVSSLVRTDCLGRIKAASLELVFHEFGRGNPTLTTQAHH